MASCAAQNAALVVLPASLQVVGAERLERGALADNLHDDLQLSRRLADAPVVYAKDAQHGNYQRRGADRHHEDTRRPRRGRPGQESVLESCRSIHRDAVVDTPHRPTERFDERLRAGRLHQDEHFAL